MNNKEIINLKRKEYYKNNKEKELNAIKKYNKSENGRSKSRISCIKYRKKNKHRVSLYNKEYWIKNKEKLSLSKKLYKINNIEKIRKSKNNYNNRKYKEDPGFRIISLLRCRIRDLLRDKRKSNTTMKLIGCSIEFLKNHLQQTAINNGYLNFNINNFYSKEYHVDHIIPCDAFNLFCSYHQRLCFNWSNMQILKAKENLLKSNKY